MIFAAEDLSGLLRNRTRVLGERGEFGGAAGGGGAVRSVVNVLMRQGIDSLPSVGVVNLP